MKLEEYIFKEKITKTAFAERLGITRDHLYAILAGRERCSGTLARLIVYETGGDVTYQAMTGKRLPKGKRKE